ncbi:ATP-binding cassette domain-containing protein [Microbulbifer sp. EKSA005]|uniref:ATP-binding cassette domain-containing protein n=1 Tax=Microbulbifer sp. EKSA005 TaxID=3243364 RepID=UPI0040420A43
MQPKYDKFNLVIELIKPFKFKFGVLFGVSIFQAIVFTIFDPVALKYLIDAITTGDIKLFLIISLAVLLITTSGRYLGYLTALMRQNLKNEIQKNLCTELTSAYYNHDYTKVSSNGKGYYISRLHDEPKQLATVVDVILSLVVGIFVAISGIGVALWVSWQVTLTLGLIIPILYALANRFSGKISTLTNIMHEREAEFKSILSTVIDSFKLVRLFELNKDASREVKQGLKKPLDAIYQGVKCASMYRALSAAFLSYSELSVIIIAGYQVISGIITIGSLFALTRAFSMITRSVEQVTAIIPNLAMLNTLIDRYYTFKSEPNGLYIQERLKAPSFSLKAVEYSYEGKSIFNNVDLEIGADNRILVNGPNGSGKSTLANLLAGFYIPSKGSIAGPRQDELSCSLYPFGLLPGTIEDNLNIVGSKYGSKDRISTLIEELELNNCLDLKYESLSEGQKKKCQIALCLLKPAGTYIFDEPLANIDDKAKNRVLELINLFTKGSMLMMIMHEGKRFSDTFDSILNIKGDGSISLKKMNPNI